MQVCISNYLFDIENYVSYGANGSDFTVWHQHRRIHLSGIRLIQNENRDTSWRNSVVVDSHSHIVSMKYRLNNI